MPRPIPRAPPVTTTTLPVKSKASSSAGVVESEALTGPEVTRPPASMKEALGTFATLRL